jgi:hypothetical protein
LQIDLDDNGVVSSKELGEWFQWILNTDISPAMLEGLAAFANRHMDCADHCEASGPPVTTFEDVSRFYGKHVAPHVSSVGLAAFAKELQVKLPGALARTDWPGRMERVVLIVVEAIFSVFITWRGRRRDRVPSAQRAGGRAGAGDEGTADGGGGGGGGGGCGVGDCGSVDDGGSDGTGSDKDRSNTDSACSSASVSLHSDSVAESVDLMADIEAALLDFSDG